MSTGIILVAAGSGHRFGRAKALVQLGGISLIARAAAPFADFADRVAVIRAQDREHLDLPGWTLIDGGARRRDSVAAGVAALRAGTTRVLIHDAARPLVSHALVARVLAATDPAVIPAVAVTDTIKEVAGPWVARTPPRDRLVAVQTPQAFDLGLLRRALEQSNDDATDEAALVEALGARVRVVAGEAGNLKITAPEDIFVAEALLARKK